MVQEVAQDAHRPLLDGEPSRPRRPVIERRELLDLRLTVFSQVVELADRAVGHFEVLETRSLPSKIHLELQAPRTFRQKPGAQDIRGDRAADQTIALESVLLGDRGAEVFERFFARAHLRDRSRDRYHADAPLAIDSRIMVNGEEVDVQAGLTIPGKALSLAAMAGGSRMDDTRPGRT